MKNLIRTTLVASFLLAGTAQAENLAVIWTGCTAPIIGSCSAVKYDIPTATDKVRTNSASNALVDFGTLSATATLQSCVTPNVTRGALAVIPPAAWSAATDPCKAQAYLPASTWAIPVTPVSVTSTLSWIPPTQDTANQPLTGANALTAVHVFASLSPITDTAVLVPTQTLPGNAASSSYTRTVTPPAVLYFRLKVLNASGVSIYGTQATKNVPIPVPVYKEPKPATNLVAE